MNQQDLADKLGLSLSAISSYERGVNSPDDDVKVQLAQMFNISLDYLLGATNDEIPLIRENNIVLPKGFPQKYLSIIDDYIALIMEREKTGKGSRAQKR